MDEVKPTEGRPPLPKRIRMVDENEGYGRIPDPSLPRDDEEVREYYGDD